MRECMPQARMTFPARQMMIEKLKKLAPIFLIALLSAGAMASFCFFTRAETVSQVISGLTSGAGIEKTTWQNALVAGAYQLGGWTAADAARSGIVFILWLSGFLIAGIVIQKFGPAAARILFYFTAIATLAWGTYQSVEAYKKDIHDLRLLAPVSLFESAQKIGGRIFMNPASVPAAALLAPEHIATLPPLKTLSELCKSPAVWRSENRKTPFSSILLTGDIKVAQSLIESLPSDWRLAQSDNHGVLFVRVSDTILSSQTDFKSPREQAIFLAQSGLVLESLDRQLEARKMMDDAIKLAPDDPLVLTKSATLAATQTRWNQTREDATKTLKNDSGSVSARYLLALSLLETGQISQASDQADRLHDTNAQILMLKARIARAANDATAEIAALERLLKITLKQKQPATGVHIFLGQAWARRGFAKQALENYEAALQGELNDDQRKEINNAIANIRLKTEPRVSPPIKQ